ncbi:MAG: hypothetical protein AcusKO_37830 [Acuticoccus sp.]
MQSTRSTAILEIAVYAALIFVSAAIFIGTIGLPVSNREPLGSASIPQAVSVLVALMCLVLMARAIRVLRAERDTAPAPPPGADEGGEAAPTYRRRFDLALGIFGLALVFTFLLQVRLVPAQFLIGGLLGLGFLLLNRFRLKAVLPSVVIAVAVAVATTYVFKSFFYIDLP